MNEYNTLSSDNNRYKKVSNNRALRDETDSLDREDNKENDYKSTNDS